MKCIYLPQLEHVLPPITYNVFVDERGREVQNQGKRPNNILKPPASAVNDKDSVEPAKKPAEDQPSSDAAGEGEE